MEIKFRAWHKEQKQFIGFWSNGLYMYENGQIYSGNMNVTERIELQQYINLKDKNDKEIYEGDVLEFEDMGEEGYEYIEGYDFTNRAVIVFEEGRFTLDKFIYDNSGVIEELNNQEELVQTIQRSKIIGNIYENPELLEESL